MAHQDKKELIGTPLFRETNNKIKSKAEKAALRQKEFSEMEKQRKSLKRQNEFSERTKIWKTLIIPQWDTIADSKKVKELCIKGIPPNMRGTVWPLLIGNDLNVRIFFT